MLPSFYFLFLLIVFQQYFYINVYVPKFAFLFFSTGNKWELGFFFFLLLEEAHAKASMG